MDGNKEEPRIPIKEIHEILSIELRDFKYLVFAIEKEEINKTQGHLYSFTNFNKAEALDILEDVVKQLKEGTTINNYVNSNNKDKKL